jgi:uncharacterized YceG family protein
MKPTQQEIFRRRMTAVAIVVAVAFIGIGVVELARPGHKAAPPPTTTVAPPETFRIVFPEGFTRAQMAQRVEDVAKIAERKSGKPVKLSKRAYLAATRTITVPCFSPRRRTNAEGFLFPATYDFDATTTSRQLVQDQIQALCDHWGNLNLRYARAKNLTSYDILSIASMIERETAAPSERKLVAAVIYNRLHNQMPLGIDATLRYGLNIPPTQSILESQLQSQSPYNTRIHTGLPPTPIANPGLASIKAAAHPADVNYLYFVRKPDKIHNFFTASASAFAQYECAHGYGCG